MFALLTALWTASAPADGGALRTWRCTSSNADWSTADCSQEGEPPVDGDSVLIQSDTPIQGVPEITLKNLTYSGGADGHLDPDDANAAGITVAGQLRWTEGAINMPVTIESGASGTLVAGARKEIDGDLTVRGSLSLRNTGSEEASGLHFDDPHSLVIPAGGVVTSTGDSEVFGGDCCGTQGLHRVVNEGVLNIPDGRLSINKMARYQDGALSGSRRAGRRLTEVRRPGQPRQDPSPGPLPGLLPLIGGAR